VSRRDPGVRVGLGFDVHAFAEGRPLMLGGVAVPHGRGLAGHSDADVLLHAVCDALLGAAALGDIGRHFPDSDPSLRGVPSLELLRRTVGLLADAGWAPWQVDACVIAEEPRIGDHAARMRAAIADALGIDAGRVGLKATTTERLGFVGRREGIAAEAVCLLVPAERAP